MTTAAVLTRLDAIEDDLATALALLHLAEPTLWRSPAARAYRERLEDLRDRLRQLSAVCRGARPQVGFALSQDAPDDPLFRPSLW